MEGGWFLLRSVFCVCQLFCTETTLLSLVGRSTKGPPFPWTWWAKAALRFLPACASQADGPLGFSVAKKAS